MRTAYVYLKDGDCFSIKNYESMNDGIIDCAILFRGDGEKLKLCVNKDRFSHMTVEYKEDVK